MKKLSIVDLKDIEVLTRDVEIVKLEMQLETMISEKISLEIESLNNVLEKQKIFVIAKEKNYQNKKNDFNIFLKKLVSKYGKSLENFSYNPKTGKIKEK